MNKEKHKDKLLKALKISSENLLRVCAEDRDFNSNSDDSISSLPIHDDILVIQLAGIGDKILASGFIRELKLNNPSSNIWLLTHTTGYQIYKYCPYLYKIISWEFNIDTKGMLNYVSQYFWDFRFKMILLPQWNDMGATMLASFIGAKYIVGYGCNPHAIYGLTPLTKFNIDELCLTHIVLTPDYSYSDMYRKFYILEQLGYKISSYKLELWLDKDDYYPIPNDSIILGIGGSLKCKKYPVELLAQACIEINKLYKYTFIIIGGSSEQDDSVKLENIFRDNDISYINLTNKLTIRQTISVIGQSKLYIGNDTGVLHIAYAANKPIIGIYMEAKDKNLFPGFISAIARFKPYQYDKFIALQPEHALDDCIHTEMEGGCSAKEPHCIKQIPYEQIINAYKQLIH